MALTNAQYEAVMRRYDAIREQHRYEQSRRTEEVYHAIPEMAALDDEAAAKSMEAARSRISDPGADLSAYRSSMRDVAERRIRLLKKAGYPEDYLEPVYSCPLCHDTGYADGQKCICFDRIAADMLYGRYSLRTALEAENFDHFSFRYYSDTIKDSTTNLTPRASAEAGLREARETAAHIGMPDNNLYLYGNTGTGKTFLAHCITKAALDDGRYVLYFPAPDLFDALSGTSWRTGRSDTGRSMIREAELLVIDDLGTELTNSFTVSELFRVINERISENRSTVISTNLSLERLKDKYSERVFSRIASHYRIVHLTGDDIRIQKKLLS